jgi:hypothetical protein
MHNGGRSIQGLRFVQMSSRTRNKTYLCLKRPPWKLMWNTPTAFLSLPLLGGLGTHHIMIWIRTITCATLVDILTSTLSFSLDPCMQHVPIPLGSILFKILRPGLLSAPSTLQPFSLAKPTERFNCPGLKLFQAGTAAKVPLALRPRDWQSLNSAAISM